MDEAVGGSKPTDLLGRAEPSPEGVVRNGAFEGPVGGGTRGDRASLWDVGPCVSMGVSQ